MIPFLMTISFLIHALSLFALIILFQRQNKISESEKKIKQASKEMEDMMTSFLIDIKEENEQLIAKLNKTESVDQTSTTELIEKADTFSPPLVPRKTAAKAYTRAKALPKEMKTSNTEVQSSKAAIKIGAEAELPLAEKMSAMKKQGMKDEEIAKTLHIGVTEVKLALKFYKNE